MQYFMLNYENDTFCNLSTVHKKIFEKSITDEGIKHTLGVLHVGLKYYQLVIHKYNFCSKIFTIQKLRQFI